jgi:hypothetical protein
MNDNEIRIYKLIDEITWNDWDPIGVNEFQGAREEYYSYLPAIFDLKISGSDKETIAQYLFRIETERIGLFGNIDNCRVVAQKIDEI